MSKRIMRGFGGKAVLVGSGRKRFGGKKLNLSKKRLELRRKAKLRAAKARLLRAIQSADSRGYTGMLNSKGGLYDDPNVIKASREYDRILGIETSAIWDE